MQRRSGLPEDQSGHSLRPRAPPVCRVCRDDVPLFRHDEDLQSERNLRGRLFGNEGVHGRKRVLQRTLSRHEGRRAQLRLVRSQVRDDERNAFVRGGGMQVELRGRLHALRAPRSEHRMRSEHRARRDEVRVVHQQLQHGRAARDHDVHQRPVRLRDVPRLLLQRRWESWQRLRSVVRCEDGAVLPGRPSVQTGVQLQRRLR